MLSFFPLDVLDEIWDLIESVSEGFHQPGGVVQSVGHLTRKSGILGSIPGWQHTLVSPSAFSRRAVVSYW